MKTVRLASLVLWSAVLAFAQSFSSVSVKPAASGIQMESGGPGSPDPGQVTYTAVPLRRLVMVAWSLTQPFQVSAPRWLDDERYDVVVRFPPDSSQDQFRSMLRHFLTDRFSLVAHTDAREMAGYELTVATGGLKMKESSASSARPGVSTRATRPGVSTRATRPGVHEVSGRLQAMNDIAELCMKLLNRPVVDKTGISGKYDFSFLFAPAPVPEAAANLAPDLATAMEDSLGLKLESKVMSYSVLIVERAEKAPAGK